MSSGNVRLGICPEAIIGIYPTYWHTCVLMPEYIGRSRPGQMSCQENNLLRDICKPGATIVNR
jgi:hypothetical protein